MDSDPAPAARPELHWSAVLYKRLMDQMPQSRRGRLLTAIFVGGVLMAMSIGLLLLPIWVDLSEDRFSTFGYAGVFLANLVSTGTVFIPVPGLTAIGQALILHSSLNPVLRLIVIDTGLILPLSGCNTGGVILAASATLSVLIAQPLPSNPFITVFPGI